MQGLLTTASKTNGQYAFNFATVPFLAEILKLLISCWLLRRQKLEDPEVCLEDSEGIIEQSIPACSDYVWAFGSLQALRH